MSLFGRWCRFNAVGALGMAVQLVTLALLNRWTGGHYLVSTAAALELTLIHNFLWHLHYTWRDRRDSSAVLAQMIKFHLSNGMISLIGNLALMRILVGVAGMPVLLANAIAILICSLTNFGLGHLWAFAPAKSE